MTKTETMEVALDDIRVTTNHRTYFQQDRMKELTDNIKAFGVLEPLLVRRVDDEIHLIAGARRLRAARGAGLTMVPVRILAVDAEAAAEIQLLENLQREGLGPIEEARAFKTLLENGKHTVESLAERVDKSVAYVYRALRLIELPELAIEMIERGIVTPAHGHQIMRAAPDQRDEIVEYLSKMLKVQPLSVSALRGHIDYHHGADLSRAIFPKGKAYAGEMACSACPFNSGNQGNLFDGAEKGKCNNVPCFQKKTGMFLEDYSKAQAAEHSGLQYLGIHPVDATGTAEGIRRSTVILPSGWVKQVMKENPEKFGWIVVAPRNPGDKPTTSIICMDKRFLDTKEASHRKERHTSTIGQDRGNAAEREEDRRGGAPSEQELFTEDAVKKALESAVEATVAPNKRFDYTDAQWGVINYAIHGPDNWEGMKNTPRPDLARALLVKLIFELPDPTAALKDLGINPEKVTAAAIKKADADWKKAQDAKK